MLFRKELALAALLASAGLFQPIAEARADDSLVRPALANVPAIKGESAAFAPASGNQAAPPNSLPSGPPAIPSTPPAAGISVPGVSSHPAMLAVAGVALNPSAAGGAHGKTPGRTK